MIATQHFYAWQRRWRIPGFADRGKRLAITVEQYGCLQVVDLRFAQNVARRIIVFKAQRYFAIECHQTGLSPNVLNQIVDRLVAQIKTCRQHARYNREQTGQHDNRDQFFSQ